MNASCAVGHVKKLVMDVGTVLSESEEIRAWCCVVLLHFSSMFIIALMLITSQNRPRVCYCEPCGTRT